MSDSADTIPSSRSGRIVDGARKNPFSAVSGAAVPLLFALTALFEHLERIQRINSALGWQVGTITAVGVILLATYQRHRDQRDDVHSRERADARGAYLAAMEREGEKYREAFREAVIDVKNAHAETSRRVDRLAERVETLTKKIDETGPQRRLGGPLYGVPR